jgi:hypothetical protein
MDRLLIAAFIILASTDAYPQQHLVQESAFNDNIVACERYDLDACYRISRYQIINLILGDGVNPEQRETKARVNRFNTALKNTSTFAKYLNDCRVQDASACRSALQMPNITEARRAEILRIRDAMPPAPGFIPDVALILAIIAALALAIFIVSKIPTMWAAFKQHLAARQMKAALSAQQNGRQQMSVLTNKQEQDRDQAEYHSYFGQVESALRRDKRDTPRNPDEPHSFLASVIIVGARGFAGIIMLVLWLVIIGPVWFAMLLRTIAAFSIATVFALFTSATPPSVARLDAIAELWVRGFTKIVSNFMQRDYSAPAMYIPLKPLEALQETGLAMLLYAGLLLSFWTTTHLTGYIDIVYLHYFE